MQQNTTELSSLELSQNISSPEKRPVGRPATPVDWEKVKSFLAFGATATEIAAVLDVSEDVLYRAAKRDFQQTFEDWAEPQRAKSNVLLRQVIYQRALAGDKQLLILWARRYLGFEQQLEVKGKIEHEHLHAHINLTGDAKQKRIEELQSLLLPKTADSSTLTADAVNTTDTDDQA